VDPWVDLVVDAPTGEPGRTITLTATCDVTIHDQIRAVFIHVDRVARWVERDTAMYAILVPELGYETSAYVPQDDDITIRAAGGRCTVKAPFVPRHVGVYRVYIDIALADKTKVISHPIYVSATPAAGGKGKLRADWLPADHAEELPAIRKHKIGVTAALSATTVEKGQPVFLTTRETTDCVDVLMTHQWDAATGWHEWRFPLAASATTDLGLKRIIRKEEPGSKFEITPKSSGIYQLVAVGRSPSGGKITSAPMILVVRPKPSDVQVDTISAKDAKNREFDMTAPCD
jgi:hypothetical protein